MPRTPGSIRLPLAELSPGNRNRIIGARAHGIPFATIADQKNCSFSAVYFTVRNALFRAGQYSQPQRRPPTKLSEYNKRRIYKTIDQSLKITAAKLIATIVLYITKKTVYRFLKKSGIQKWQCRKQPLLNNKRTAARLK